MIKFDEIVANIQKKDYLFWENQKNKHILDLFRRAAELVPAYRDFLKKHHIASDKIKTVKDLRQVPPVDKKGYLRRYPLAQLMWPEELNRTHVFSATSGSSGIPYYFPRNDNLDQQSSLIHELYYLNGLREKKRKKVLVIDAFGMGVWIGGLITYQAFKAFGVREKYPITILTTGINKEEIFKALRNLAPSYDQIIMTGYPPFLKDVIDEAAAIGLPIRNYNIRIIFAAEAFTERFRDHMVKVAKVKNLFLDTMNIYGSSDIGTMAFETPVTILARRLAAENKPLFEQLFSAIKKTPTFAQHIPTFTDFETENGEILLTGDNSIPLIRYDIGDNGGVMNFGDMVTRFADCGIDFRQEMRKAGLVNYCYQLPMVYVYERRDFSVSLYGLQVYPESIREAILHQKINRFLTGKFTMMTKFDQRNNQYLEINLEKKKNIKLNRKIKSLILDVIIAFLNQKNAEYRELYSHIHDRAKPKLVFWESSHPIYFKEGGKQKWVLQNQ